MNIIDKLKSLGYTTIDASWYDYVAMWDSWYKGNVAKFHEFHVFNGQNKVKCKRYSLGMAKKVAEDWANLLMNEKVKITVEGDKEQKYIDDIFERNDFEVNANELQEKGAARGTYAIVPRIMNLSVSENGVAFGGEIALDYVTAEHIFPLSWRGRDISECAFATTLVSDGKKYLYMQLHVKPDGKYYTIINKMYSAVNDTLSDANLSEVKGYENVAEIIPTGSDQPQFVIGRYNIANNITDNNPMGISVYANAIDCLKGVDVAFDSYINEFVLGKKRIIVKPAVTKTLEGESVFDPNDITFYVLPEDLKDGAIIDPIDMKLRTTEHTEGLQNQLNVLSSKCGFGEQHYKFDNGNVSTATQIISENSEMFRTIKKHEILLNSFIVELCRILLRLGNTYLNAGLKEDVEISVDFDDSIIEDKTADFEKDMRLLNAGIMNDWEFRAKWMNEDEETAKAALPKMQDMTEQGQDEVE